MGGLSREGIMNRIRGVIPPVLTPFKANGEVDYDAYGRNLERWNSYPLGGYLVLGSNSESVYLSEEEKLELVQLTVKGAGQRLVLAGTGLESTRETIALTNKAARLGAHAALVLTPGYYGSRMNDRALIAHFSALADAADIPIMMYNVPKFTHVNLSGRAVEELSGHPNIAGMKDSAGDVAQLVSFQRVIPADFNLMVGTASVWYPALTLGLTAGIMALANCCPAECVQIQQLWEADRPAEAEALFRRMSPVNAAVTAVYGVAGLKYAAEALGYSAGYTRSPLQPLDDEEQSRMRRILSEAQLI